MNCSIFLGLSVPYTRPDRRKNQPLLLGTVSMAWSPGADIIDVFDYAKSYHRLRNRRLCGLAQHVLRSKNSQVYSDGCRASSLSLSSPKVSTSDQILGVEGVCL